MRYAVGYTWQRLGAIGIFEALVSHCLDFQVRLLGLSVDVFVHMKTGWSHRLHRCTNESVQAGRFGNSRNMKKMQTLANTGKHWPNARHTSRSASATAFQIHTCLLNGETDSSNCIQPTQAHTWHIHLHIMRLQNSANWFEGQRGTLVKRIERRSWNIGIDRMARLLGNSKAQMLLAALGCSWQGPE